MWGYSSFDDQETWQLVIARGLAGVQFLLSEQVNSENNLLKFHEGSIRFQESIFKGP